MARNQEKSHSMLNRWLSMQREMSGQAPKKRTGPRPYLASMVDNLSDAEHWRENLIRELGKTVLLLQNEDHKVRDLNDKANKLMREKWHWNQRIKELGGPDYQDSQRVSDDAAIRAPGGYWYFGVAKNLPGVQELLKPTAPEAQKRTRHDLYQGVDADYYGFRDDDDGILAPLETEAESRAREEAISEWNRSAIEKYGSLSAAPIPRPLSPSDNIPTLREAEELILEKKKEELIARYAS